MDLGSATRRSGSQGSNQSLEGWKALRVVGLLPTGPGGTEASLARVSTREHADGTEVGDPSPLLKSAGLPPEERRLLPRGRQRASHRWWIRNDHRFFTIPAMN